MKFKTSQAQEAYAEMVAQMWRAVQEMRNELQQLGKAQPEEALTLAVTAAIKTAQLQTEGLAKAIEVGADVDMRWSSLVGSLAIVAGGGDA